MHDGDSLPVRAFQVTSASIEGLAKCAQQPLPRERLFEKIAALSPDLIYVCDLLGRQTAYINPAVTRVLGYTPEEIEAMGEGVAGMLHPEHLLPAFEHHANFVRLPEGSVAEIDVRMRHANGSYRWLRCRETVFARDAKGRPTHVLGIAEDVTDQKAQAAELRDANRRKDQFIATLAHELRNPLAPMRTGLDVLQRLPADAAERAGIVAIIDRQVTQMTRLVEDLMEVSRITRGMIELRKECIDLGAVVRHCADAAATAVAAGEQTLVLELPADPLMVVADPVRLSQVITNLLSNACKFTDQSGRITLSAWHDGGTVVLQVRDDGFGIPRDMLARVFEPFMQVDRSYGSALGGLGIGLTLVKQLVEAHGGTVAAESDGDGKGAVFTVRLPQAEGVVQKADARQDPAKVTRGTALRVLVVDDNEDAVISQSLVMRLDGNDVRTACDADEAERIAEEFRPHVVLLDIGMPRRSGHDVARHIRAQPWGKRMLLVALTGWGQEQDRLRSKASGFDAHLVKPVDHAELSRVLAAFSERGG
jgi:two-component system CheB/CheR fusion protein